MRFSKTYVKETPFFVEDIQVSYKVIYAAIILSYYCISGMATTNILRLLKESSAKQNDLHCYCGHCGHLIPLYHQFPIFSYFASKKKCRYCGTSIPFSNTAVEIMIFGTMSLITLLFNFRLSGIIMSFIAYEIIRLVMILRFGHRKDSFAKEYIIAVAYMFFAFLLVFFMAVLANSIKSGGTV